MKKSSLQLSKTAYFDRDLIECKGATVVFLGRSNVGKSSILNTITQSSLAQVSKNPGKTRSINYYRWNEILWLVDLPGYGFAKRSRDERDKWKELTFKFFETLPKTTFIFLLVDSKRVLEDEEFELLDSLILNQFPLCLLWTKSDRLNQSERQKLLRYSLSQDLEKKNSLEIQNTLTYHLISVKSGEGIRELQRDIWDYVKNFSLQNPKNDRQRSPSSDGHREAGL